MGSSRTGRLKEILRLWMPGSSWSAPFPEKSGFQKTPYHGERYRSLSIELKVRDSCAVALRFSRALAHARITRHRQRIAALLNAGEYRRNVTQGLGMELG